MSSNVSLILCFPEAHPKIHSGMISAICSLWERIIDSLILAQALVQGKIIKLLKNKTLIRSRSQGYLIGDIEIHITLC